MQFTHPTHPTRSFRGRQKGCKRGRCGTVDHLLLLDKIRLENCKLQQTNLSIAWKDYKKPLIFRHSWMIKCMQVYKINPQIVTRIEKAMILWNTVLIQPYLEGKMENRSKDMMWYLTR